MCFMRASLKPRKDEEMKLYKALDRNGKPNNGGSGIYHLPSKRKDGTWKPGKWMPAIKGDLVPCENGYHLCRKKDLLDWLGPDIYEAEYKGKRIDNDNKIIVRQVRLLRRVETWHERSAREFACWCWSLLKDERSKNAIVVAERFAKGEATSEELAFARDADRAAADWAGAARAAVRAAQTKYLFELLSEQ